MLLTHAFHTHLLIDIRPVIETEYAYILLVQSELQIWVQNCVVISSVGAVAKHSQFFELFASGSVYAS